jgi:long-chain acyl-CoA synthetase
MSPAATPATEPAPSLEPAPNLLFARAAAEPDRVRFLEPEVVTLGVLADRVRAVSTWLVARGVKPGDHVAMWADNSLNWLITAWAIQAAGAAFVSVHAPSSRTQADFIRADSGAVLFVSDCAHDADADLVLDGPSMADALSTPAGALPDVAADDRACLIYTSGTTGAPKGVVLTHHNLFVNGEDWLNVVGPLLPVDAVEVSWLPMSHIFGWGALCVGTAFGMQTALCSFHDLAPALARVRPHFLCAVPLVWDHLPPAATGGRFQLGLSGAAPLKTATKARYSDAGLCLLEGYGLTETSPTLTLERADQTDRDTVGRVYPSVEVRIAADGEVQARGPSVFSGYWNRTDQPFDDEGWFCTGDLGVWQDGALRIVGRKKELIVLRGGKKVSPAAVEAQFQALSADALGRAVVVGDNWRHVGALIFSTTDADPADPIAQLNETVGRAERIRAYTVIPELPSVENGMLTASLKLRRHVVAQRYQAEIADLAHQVEHA